MVEQISPFETAYQAGRSTIFYIFIICAKYLGRYIDFMSTQSKPGIGIRLTRDSQTSLTRCLPTIVLILQKTKRPQEMSNTPWTATVKFHVS